MIYGGAQGLGGALAREVREALGWEAWLLGRHDAAPDPFPGWVFLAARRRTGPEGLGIVEHHARVLEGAPEGSTVTFVGSEAATRVSLTQGPLYHAEKGALLQLMRWWAAARPKSQFNMVSPPAFSRPGLDPGDRMDCGRLAALIVAFALLARAHGLTGQHLDLWTSQALR